MVRNKKHFQMQACQWIYLRSNKMFNNLENAANGFCESSRIRWGNSLLTVHSMDVAWLRLLNIFSPNYIELLTCFLFLFVSVFHLCDTIDDLFYELLSLTRNDLLVSWLANFVGSLSCRSRLYLGNSIICYFNWSRNEQKMISHIGLVRNQQQFIICVNKVQLSICFNFNW